MTEEQWLNATDPSAMLAFLRATNLGSERKLRLFAVACCRAVWRSIPLGGCRAAVVAAERYCDGLADVQELESSRAAAEYTVESLTSSMSSVYHSLRAPAFAAACVAGTGGGAVLSVVDELHRGDGGSGNHHRCKVLRDIVGNPFHPLLAIDPAWLTWSNGIVKRLAGAAYQERALPDGILDVARFAVLADALTDAGCTDTALLEHLRGSGPHVRGCFVVDLLVGKE
jgi:hypothetical protein